MKRFCKLHVRRHRTNESETDIKRRASLDKDTKPDPGGHGKQHGKAQQPAIAPEKIYKYQSSDLPGGSRDEKLWVEEKEIIFLSTY